MAYFYLYQHYPYYRYPPDSDTHSSIRYLTSVTRDNIQKKAYTREGVFELFLAFWNSRELSIKEKYIPFNGFNKCKALSRAKDMKFVIHTEMDRSRILNK